MNHDELKELAALYSLGALSGADLDEFSAHLPGCAECTEAVRDYQEASTGFAFSLPGEAVSAAVKEKIMGAAKGAAPKRSLVWPMALAASILISALLGYLLYDAGQPKWNKALLASTEHTPDAVGYVLYKDNKVRLVVEGMPPLPEGKVYELWLLQGDKPIPAGIWSVDANGKIREADYYLDVTVEKPAFAVTVEDGFKLGPTMPLYLAPKE